MFRMHIFGEVKRWLQLQFELDSISTRAQFELDVIRGSGYNCDSSSIRARFEHDSRNEKE